MNYQPFLDYLDQYIRLTEAEASLLLSRMKYRQYRKGRYVAHEEDVCQYNSFVLSGCLRTFYSDREGHEHTVMFSTEACWVGDLGSFVSQTPAHFNVQCLENTELLQLSYDSMERLYTEIPKLERLFRIITQKALIDSERRIVINLSLPARERYLRFRQQYPHLEQRVPQYTIASYLGITKEFLSKIKSQLYLTQSGLGFTQTS